jgi:hypothetical protein
VIARLTLFRDCLLELLVLLLLCGEDFGIDEGGLVLWPDESQRRARIKSPAVDVQQERQWARWWVRWRWAQSWRAARSTCCRLRVVKEESKVGLDEVRVNEGPRPMIYDISMTCVRPVLRLYGRTRLKIKFRRLSILYSGFQTLSIDPTMPGLAEEDGLR